MTTQPPLPNKWTEYLMNIYIQGKPPLLGTVDINEIEEKAREVMKDNLPAYMYTFGSAGTCSTDAANKKAIKNWKIVPRMLVDATNRNLEITIFGVKYAAPVFIAPMGAQGILHADGEIATARAAASVGIPYIMSTGSSRSMEDVAAANGPNGQRWFQLYWPRTVEVTRSFLKRAKDNGFTALVVTLDATFVGWRPHDIKTSYLPFSCGVGIQVRTSDPVFMGQFGLEPRKGETTPFPFEPTKVGEAAYEQGDERALQQLKLGKDWLGKINSGVFRTWEDLKFLRENWDGPIVLKGIQRVSDAESAIAHGMDGIVISNHGGRQVDGAIGSLDALDEIMRSHSVRAAQKSGKLTVLFDSGIRTGSDIIKALALGAQAVLIGRPVMHGLAIAGQQGVEQILMQTVCDLDITLGLSGYRDIHEVIGKRDEVMKQEWSISIKL